MSDSLPRVSTTRAALVAWARQHVDRIGVFLGLLYGLPSLLYPFGRDQAIFFYVGREWTAGRLPYRDAFDIKPPGIYAVYAVSSALLGARQWSVRVIEWLAVVAMGWLAARAIQQNDKPAPGAIGAAVLVCAGWHYTCFDYWDTGQVEFWEGLFALAAYAAAVSIPRLGRAAFVSGLCAGIAVMFKPPIVLVLPISTLALGVRGWRDARGGALGAARTVTLQALGALSVVLLFVAYFAMRGGWGSLRELAEYTVYYARHKTTAANVRVAWTLLFWRDHVIVWALLVISLWIVGASLAFRRGSRSTALASLVPIVGVALAMASVAMQQKYWSYHWGVSTAFLVLAAAVGTREIARRSPIGALGVALAAVVVGLGVKPSHSFASPAMTYRSYIASAWRYARGRDSRWTFIQQFVGPYNYHYANEEVVGDLLGDQAAPGDSVQVRGFEPVIYAESRLSSPSRFASEAPLLDPSLDYHRDAWLSAHARVLTVTNPPRWFVTFEDWTADRAALTRRGYRERGHFGNFVWYQRE